MRVRQPLALTLLLIVAVSHPTAGAPQAAVPSPPASPPSQPPLRVVIDGSRHPELIPERVATGMFMSAIAIPLDADTRTVAFMQAKLSPMRLNGADMRVLRHELAALHARLLEQRGEIAAAYDAARLARTPDASARVAAATHGRDALAWDSYERLLETLSPAGRAHLIAQLARVKRQMKAVTVGTGRDSVGLCGEELGR